MGRTNAGRDLMARIMGDPASTGTGIYASASYMALTEDATAPVVTSTTLSGELTSPGLARAQGVYAHVDGTTTYTLSKSYTSDDVVEVNKVGVFNGAVAGTMLFEDVLDTPANLKIGDQVTITATVTL
jgi:hypothetical protein